ncbi:MAG: glycerophosphodiester phosphodiesterase [Chitinophagales bacterium]|nr:glycerophosphodiester phosphodiesterase [Chitinophagales bacterium]
MMKNFATAVLLAITSFIFAQSVYDIQGHRGCRGLYPENSIIGFIEAVKLGVNTLELDVVVSKDNQLVVSHEPWMSASFCFTSDGKSIEDNKEKYNIYQLTYEQIKQFDCGINGNSKFPEQKKISTTKPLLSEVIDAVEKYISANNLPPVYYNIETKSTPEGDNKFHPAPAEFSLLLYNLLQQKDILHRCIVQSFDPRTLQILKQKDENIVLALLVANADGFEHNITRLGFTPQIYSPNFLLVNKKLINNCHQKGIKVIPWTVNEEKKMLQLKKMGTDGVITDHPDRAIKVLRN